MKSPAVAAAELAWLRACEVRQDAAIAVKAAEKVRTTAEMVVRVTYDAFLAALDAERESMLR